MFFHKKKEKNKNYVFKYFYKLLYTFIQFVSIVSLQFITLMFVLYICNVSVMY